MKPCLSCGTPSTESRCLECAVIAERTRESRRTDRVTDRGPWKRLSKRLRRRSPFCEWCGATSELTVDHIIPHGERPDLELVVENLRVLCRSCNSSRGDRCTDDERAAVQARIAASRARRTRGVGDRRQTAPARSKPQGPSYTPGGYL